MIIDYDQIMDAITVATQLSELLETNRTVFLKTEPEVPDHTIGASFKCQIFGANNKVEIIVEPKDMMFLVAMFDSTIFDPEHVDRFYTWNFKSFATYFHFSNPNKFVIPKNSIIDLKVIENFLGIRKKSPENINEAINRTKDIVKYKNWQLVYKAVILPLSLRVLPSIESSALLNTKDKIAVYPYYEIEGQTNGRMNSYKKFSKSYTPHTMGPDVKQILKPKGYGIRFLIADFRHCEVTVLQYLSKDPKLKEILDSGEDLHAGIYRVITGDNCDTDTKRVMSKLMFLPVMYGCGAIRLADQLSVSEGVAKELIKRIKEIFCVAAEWMESKQEIAKRGEIVEDLFGRPRLIEIDKPHLARNFCVQGVAATLCLEKVIDLYDVLDENANIVFSIYDGVALCCTIKEAHATYLKVKKTLESESKLCPGFKMKVEIRFGAKLDTMKVLWKD